MNIKNAFTAALICGALSTAFADDAAKASPATTAAESISALAGNESVKGIVEKLSASAMVGYESEFIFRGKQLAGHVITPEVDLSYDIGACFGAYVGWWGCYTADNSNYSGNYEENDIYCGVTYSIENFTIDFGYTAYTYPIEGWQNEHELKLALSYDTSELLGDFAICPYVAGYYNFTYSGTTIEAGLSYSAPITKWLIGEEWGTLDIACFGGYADYTAGGLADDCGYGYAGAKIDAVVKITDFWAVSAGIRYAANSDGKGEGNDSLLWYGVSTTFGF